MKHWVGYGLAVITGMLLFTACEDEPAPEFHHLYFGLQEGRYVIYDVTEITHDDAINVHDTLSYQLKTVWGDTIIDNEGREAREFLRYKRTTPSDPWVLTDVWAGIIDGIRGELIEENQRIVKLVFAPTTYKSWDANAYNMEDPLDCYYRNIHEDTVINGNALSPTLVVEQQTYNTLIDSVRMFEMYAEPVGLVYKHFKDNHYQFSNNDVVLGREVYYRFVSTGLIP